MILSLWLVVLLVSVRGPNQKGPDQPEAAFTPPPKNAMQLNTAPYFWPPNVWGGLKVHCWCTGNPQPALRHWESWVQPVFLGLPTLPDHLESSVLSKVLQWASVRLYGTLGHLALTNFPVSLFNLYLIFLFSFLLYFFASFIINWNQFDFWLDWFYV